MKKSSLLLYFICVQNAFCAQFESLFLSQDELSVLSLDYPEGNYYVDIYLNRSRLKRSDFVISKEDETRGEMCFTQSVLSDFGIYIDLSRYQHTKETDCYVLARDAYTKVDFDSSSMQVHFEIPDAYIIPLFGDNDWDYGVAGGLINYDFNFSKSAGQRETGFVRVDSNFNLGHYVLSNKLNISKNNRGVAFETRDTVLSTVIKSIESDLAMGDLVTDSTLLSGFSYQGVMLHSNTRVRSRGYAPDITGVANSTSKISVSQYGVTIFSKMVPPGPYTITELPSVGGGELLVTITDSDGRVDEKIYPVTILPSLMRNDDVDFLVSVGKKKDLSNLFVLGEVGYGMSNATINFASLLHENYVTSSGSVAASLGDFGAISPAVYFSSAKYKEKRIVGSSYSLKYAKQFGFGPSLELSSYRFNSRNYAEFSQIDNEGGFFVNNIGEKFRYEGVLSNKFDSVYLSSSIWLRGYWGREQETTGVNINASIPIFDKKAFASFFGSYSNSTRSNIAMNEDRFTFGVSVSIPLDKFGLFSQNSVNYSNGRSVFSSGVSSSVNDRFNYNASLMSAIKPTDNSANASFNYSFDAVNTGMSATKSSNGYTVSGKASGAVILTNETGIIFSNVSSKTIGVAEVKINDENPDYNTAVQVMPLNGYVRNNLTLNMDDLDADIELQDTSYHLYPTEKAIIYREFTAKKIYRYVLKVRDSDGHFLAGWRAVDADKQHLGVVSSKGVLFFETALGNLNKITLDGGLKYCSIDLSVVDKNKLQEIVCE